MEIKNWIIDNKIRSRDAMIVIDERGWIYSMNSLAERFFGWKQDAVHGKLWPDVIPLIETQYAGSGISLKESILKAYVMGVVVDSSEVNYIPGPSNINHMLNYVIEPLNDSTGAFKGILLTIRDLETINRYGAIQYQQ